MKLPSWLKRLGVGFVILISLYVVTCAALSFHWKWRWSEVKSQLTARHEPLAMLELIPSPVPDDQNVFFAPLWADMAANPSASSFHINELLKPLASIKEGNKNELDLQKTAEPLRTPENQQQSAGEVILAGLEQAPALWNELDQSLARPIARFPVPYESFYYAYPLPHTSRIIRLVSLLNLRAAAHLESHQLDAAAGNIERMFRLADLLATEPVSITQLSRLSCLERAASRIEQGLAQWNDAQLQEFIRLLGGQDALAAGAFALRANRAGFNDFSGLLAGPPRVWYVYLLPTSFFYGEMAYLSERLQRGIDALAHARTSPRDITVSDMEPRGLFTWTHFFANLPEPAHILRMQVETPIKTQVHLDLARLGCELQRYKIAHGSYPTTLKKLEVDLPVDPLNGRPYSYERIGDGQFKLASVSKVLKSP